MLGRRRDHDVVPAQLEPVSKVMDSLGRIAAPIRATSVKRAYEPGPVTLRAPPGWADYSSGSLPRRCPGVLAARSGVRLERPQPRSGEDERA